jgi:hypothetical protein
MDTMSFTLVNMTKVSLMDTYLTSFVHAVEAALALSSAPLGSTATVTPRTISETYHTEGFESVDVISVLESWTNEPAYKCANFPRTSGVHDFMELKLKVELKLYDIDAADASDAVYSQHFLTGVHDAVGENQIFVSHIQDIEVESLQALENEEQALKDQLEESGGGGRRLSGNALDAHNFYEGRGLVGVEMDVFCTSKDVACAFNQTANDVEMEIGAHLYQAGIHDFAMVTRDIESLVAIPSGFPAVKIRYQCPFDCNFTLAPLANCSQTCGAGVKTNTVLIVEPPRFEGEACPTTPHTTTCNFPSCPAYCQHEWSEWSDCTRSCNSGNKTRTWPGIEAGSAPYPCPYIETAICEADPCPIDCVIGDWNDWNDCTESCLISTIYDTAVQSRFRSVTTDNQFGGVECPSNYEQRACANTPLCDKPIIVVHGNDVQILEASPLLTYNESGAQCSDAREGDISSRLLVRSTMFPDRTTPGYYSVLFDCTNSFESTALRARRQVVIQDRTCPVCEVNGLHMVAVEASFPYVDDGAACSDNMDGQISDIVREGSVDVEETGTYVISFRAKDGSGNWNDDAHCHASPALRTVVVEDTLKPVIALQHKDMMGGQRRRRLMAGKGIQGGSSLVVLAMGALGLAAIVAAVVDHSRRT